MMIATSFGRSRLPWASCLSTIATGTFQGPAGSTDHVCVFERAPDVDHRFSGEVERAIRLMRRAQDEEIALRDHLLERPQFRVALHERIGGEHGGRHRAER